VSEGADRRGAIYAGAEITTRISELSGRRPAYNTRAACASNRTDCHDQIAIHCLDGRDDECALGVRAHCALPQL